MNLSKKRLTAFFISFFAFALILQVSYMFGLSLQTILVSFIFSSSYAYFIEKFKTGRKLKNFGLSFLSFLVGILINYVAIAIFRFIIAGKPLSEYTSFLYSPLNDALYITTALSQLTLIATVFFWIMSFFLMRVREEEEEEDAQ